MTMFVCLIASLAYLTMAMGYGKYYVNAGTDDCREFYYARYVDWAFTTPLMLLEIAGIAGASWDVLLWLLGTDFVMIIAGLVGALVGGDEKWYFWGFGMIVFQPIIYYLIFGMDKTAKQNSGRENNQEIYKLYKKISLITAVCWTGYPIVWIFCEGTGRWSLDMECFTYTVLDILSKSVWGIVICLSRTAVGSLGGNGGGASNWQKA
jgi:bacteriorhodopsin